MKKTIIRRPAALDFSMLSPLEALRNLERSIFENRNANYETDKNYVLGQMLRPDKLHGLEHAVDLLVQGIKQDKRILIVGDFDADGATSTAVAVRCLKKFGAQYVDYLVPNRFIFGYGLTPEIVEVAREKRPDIIVTVDNGISSIDGVRTAKSYGITVIVTDHHLPSAETPAADAIVNPNQHSCEFKSKNLAGVGVIFYVMSALRKKLRELDWFQKNNLPEPSMGDVLDIVALGTVADVVPLDYNNRILVSAGLKKMRAGKAVAGIAALLSVAGKDAHRLSSSDLGFALGPRLNAAGRLDDMSLGIQCLLCDNYHQAVEYAKELDDLNRDRKLIESSMQEEALKILEAFDSTVLANTSGICLFKSDWHQGVIGILASRIKDRLHRPTIVFADNENGELKGSGRSIPGVHLRDVLDELASSYPELIRKFGGHAMAAGLSIELSALDRFQNAFDVVVEKHLTEETKKPIILSDGELPESLIQLETARAIQNLGPWGQAFPEPVFDGVFQIVQQRIVGEKHLKLMLTKNRHSNIVFDAIAFNVDLREWPNESAREVKLAYQLDINEFRGNVSAQLLVQYIEAV